MRFKAYPRPGALWHLFVIASATSVILLISGPGRSEDVSRARAPEQGNAPLAAGSPIFGRSFSEELLLGPVAKPSSTVTQPPDSLTTNMPGHWQAPSNFVFHSFTDISSWRFGAYFGVGNGDTLVHVLTSPWNSLSFYNPVYLVAGNVIYSAVELPAIPLDIELEMNLVQHFGPSGTQRFNFDVGFKHSGSLYYSPQSYQELTIGPAFRWKWFPWNDFVYTNFRLIPIGFSYTTALSQWEALQTKLGHTSHVLNFLVAELTFASSRDSKWESFVRVHHRSGINGLVGGVTGGSNYVSAGLRFSP